MFPKLTLQHVSFIIISINIRNFEAKIFTAVPSLSTLVARIVYFSFINVAFVDFVSPFVVYAGNFTSKKLTHKDVNRDLLENAPAEK